MFSNGTTSIARSTRESSLASPSEMQAESLLSSRSPRSSFHSRTRAAHTGSPGSPNTSIGFECRTDTSGLSPRPSLNSCSGPESPLHRESLTLSRASSRHESSVPALATPPLPSPQRFSLYDAPVSRSATATPTKFSLLATPTSTRSQSPSIMNLSQISMVKQRLAELERTKTLASQVASTPRSSRSRQYSPLPYSPQTPTSTRRSHGGTSLRVDTEGLSEKESIIDSYASSPRRGSPLSVFAGRSERLTSPLSRQSTIRTDTEKPANSHVPDALNSAPTFRDMCSPISAYSSDFPSPLPTPQHMPFGNIIDVVSEVQKSPSIPSRRCEGGSQEEHLDVGPARLIRSTHTIAPVERSPDPTQRFEDCARQSVTSRTPTPSQPRSSRIQSHPNSYESTPLPETVAIPERLTASAVPVRPVEHVCPRNQSSLRNGTRSPSRASTVQTGPREAEPTPKLQAPSPIQRTQSTIREQHVSSYMSAPPIRSSQIERSFPVSKSNDLPPTQRALPTVHQPHTRFPPPEPFPSTYNDQTPMNRASFSSSPKPPTPVQKTPLMLSLESPRGQHQPPISPLRGPPRPARLTKPQPLSPSTPSSQNFSAQADLPPLPPQNLVTPSPPPVTDQPVAALAVPTLAPAPAPSTHSDLPNKVVSDAPKSRGLFAALRRKGRRSSVEPPAPSVFANVAAPSPIVQVIKETIVERVPAPPIIQVDQETKQIMHSVEGAVNRVAEQEDRNGEQLSGIRSQVDTVLQELRQMPKPITPKIVQETPLPALPVPTPPVMDVTPITDRLDEMGTTLNINLPELLEKVEELMRQAEALQQAKSVVVLRNLPAIRGKSALGEDQLAEGGGSATDLAGEKKTDGEDVPDSVGGGAIVEDSEGSGEVQGTRLELFNPTQLEEKMDALLALCQQLQIERQNAIKAESSGKEELEQDDAEESARSDVVQRNAELQGILELLKNDLDLRAAQTDQQVDSVRYLHELNSWLEAFVNHGTSQIDQVLAGVNHLRKELGPLPDMQTMQDLSSSNNAGDSQQEHPSNLLSEIRHLLVASRNREGNTLALEASVNGLVAAVQEDLRRGAESRNAMTTESIVGLIERHRQDQERLLRNVASDLSNDIRGERLRFVEAMKEATAINVQIHVEEFKKELTREVLMATQEVGRLQKERQNLEQQIADLFSFYAKQKQSGGQQPQDPRPSLGPQRCSAPPPRVHNPKPLPSMRRRPLPSPSSRPPSAMR
ncbi:hypothetical protein BXZ70DRAFT_9418 [Cristinia sonorae]|uniref:Uncharacterized protein n=1 Tax=Cristinia sonorae TaxID=1940300 RepID=A0A8K0UY17_9AGAR|nr:hypothetical protein BXZ70DRAFT_9418 [Cristinia sonorae]